MPVTAGIENVIKSKATMIAELEQGQELHVRCGECTFGFLDQQDMLKIT